MNLLHTSDWHLGRTLHRKKRHEEFDAFLAWLLDTIERERVDALLVAGDIFDTGTPGTRAQEQYYGFLAKVAQSCCRHVVIIAGNHDAPSFLDAPRGLLKAFDIHVVGAVPENRDAEIVQLKNRDGAVELIVCAVPYLHDRDVHTPEAGESAGVKEEKLSKGIIAHYTKVVDSALLLRDTAGNAIPVVVMGHLFTTGGKTTDDKSERELYVGSLGQVPVDFFSSRVDYVALGHLHVPQRVGHADFRRYCGSPLPMGFGEATQQKSVVKVSFDGREPSVAPISVPQFQRLERVGGTLQEILDRLHILANDQETIWIEISYTGSEIVADLREQIEKAVKDTGLEIIIIKNKSAIERVLAGASEAESLHSLDVNVVFERCLSAKNVDPSQWPELKRAYREAVAAVEQQEPQA